MSLTPFEIQQATEMLDRLSDIQGNAGCNDYAIPMTQENVDWLNAYEDWNGDEYAEPYVFDAGQEMVHCTDFIVTLWAI